jgi:hypothetical protein
MAAHLVGGQGLAVHRRRHDRFGAIRQRRPGAEQQKRDQQNTHA